MFGFDATRSGRGRSHQPRGEEGSGLAGISGLGDCTGSTVAVKGAASTVVDIVVAGSSEPPARFPITQPASAASNRTDSDTVVIVRRMNFLSIVPRRRFLESHAESIEVWARLPDIGLVILRKPKGGGTLIGKHAIPLRRQIDQQERSRMRSLLSSTVAPNIHRKRPVHYWSPRREPIQELNRVYSGVRGKTFVPSRAGPQILPLNNKAGARPNVCSLPLFDNPIDFQREGSISSGSAHSPGSLMYLL